MDFDKNCPDCSATTGSLHKLGCDVEVCPDCGGQQISCDCDHEDDFIHDRLPWTGEWPGKAECREYDLWSKWVDGGGWVKCTATDPDAGEDLNALYYYRWDAMLRKRVKD